MTAVSQRPNSTAPSARTWNRWAENGQAFQLITDTELVRFRDHCLAPDRRVAVDAGCGNGAFSRQLCRFGYDVTGLDFAHTALTAARRTTWPGLRYLHHDLDGGDPPGLPHHGIDLVVCRLVLAFLSQPDTWLRRVRDYWLRPGGRVYAVIPLVDGHAPQPGGMTEREISALGHGWASVVRYDLRGPLACLVLRASAT